MNIPNTTLGLTVALVISLIANLCGTVLRRVYQNMERGSEGETRSKFLLLSFASAFLVMLLTQRIASLSPFTLILSILFGLVTLLQSEVCLRAFERGPVSYSVVIISLSTLIPTLSGAVFWDETVTPIQGIGIALLVVSLLLSVNQSADKRTATGGTGTADRPKRGWLALCMVAFLLTGLIGVMQKVHQSSPYKQELPAFMLISFGLSLLYSAVSYTVFRIRHRRSDKASAVPAETLAGSFFGRAEVLPSILALIAGVGVALNNVINLMLSGLLPSAVFFPIVNGGGLVLTTVTSVLLFREKLSVRQWLGIVAGIASVLLLCGL